MQNSSLKTVIKPSSSRYADRGSRFMGYIFPVSDLKTVEKKRQQIIKKYPDASHHCYAWRLNPFQPKEYVQDDGEPAGTAGWPIMGVIKSESLFNIVIIVVRYYGGTKLGKTGLIHAYRETAMRTIANAQIRPFQLMVPFKISYPYNRENNIRELENRFLLVVKNEQYLEQVTISVYCNACNADELKKNLDHLVHFEISYSVLPKCYIPLDMNQ